MRRKIYNPQLISKDGKMLNTPNLKPNIVLGVKIRDIGNSPHNVVDLSSSDDSSGDGGVSGGQVESSNVG